jgi:hypothetical protein
VAVAAQSSIRVKVQIKNCNAAVTSTAASNGFGRSKKVLENKIIRSVVMTDHNVEIYFIGLICMISRNKDPNKKTHAAVVDACDHRPEILFPEASNPVPLIHEVSFGAAGVASPHDGFKDHIPTFAHLVNGALDPAVQQASSPKAAYVQLLPGTLFVADTFRTGASFKLEGEAAHEYRCVARLTWLLTEKSEVPVIVNNDKKGDARRWILIRNSPIHTHSHGGTFVSPGEAHVKFFRNIAVDSTKSAEVRPLKCTTPNIVLGNYYDEVIKAIGKRAEEVDCVGSQWP